MGVIHDADAPSPPELLVRHGHPHASLASGRFRVARRSSRVSLHPALREPWSRCRSSVTWSSRPPSSQDRRDPRPVGLHAPPSHSGAPARTARPQTAPPRRRSTRPVCGAVGVRHAVGGERDFETLHPPRRSCLRRGLRPTPSGCHTNRIGGPSPPSPSSVGTEPGTLPAQRRELGERSPSLCPSSSRGWSGQGSNGALMRRPRHRGSGAAPAHPTRQGRSRPSSSPRVTEPAGRGDLHATPPAVEGAMAPLDGCQHPHRPLLSVARESIACSRQLRHVFGHISRHSVNHVFGHDFVTKSDRRGGDGWAMM